MVWFTMAGYGYLANPTKDGGLRSRTSAPVTLTLSLILSLSLNRMRVTLA